MKFLIIGDGLLGTAMWNELTSAGHTCLRTSRKRGSELFFDLSDLEGLSDLPTVDWCVITAAVTGFQECETDPSAFHVNVANTLRLAEFMNGKGTKVLFPSTSAVFDGMKSFVGPDHLPAPETEYARHKVAVEEQLLRAEIQNLVVRCSKLLDFKSGLLGGWIETLHSNRTIEAFDDLAVSPVNVGRAAKAMRLLMERCDKGVFHISSCEEFNYYDFAVMLAKTLGRDEKLVKRTSCAGRKILYKPQHSSLDSSSTVEATGVTFPGLADYFEFDFSEADNCLE